MVETKWRHKACIDICCHMSQKPTLDQKRKDPRFTFIVSFYGFKNYIYQFVSRYAMTNGITTLSMSVSQTSSSTLMVNPSGLKKRIQKLLMTGLCIQPRESILLWPLVLAGRYELIKCIKFQQNKKHFLEVNTLLNCHSSTR